MLERSHRSFTGEERAELQQLLTCGPATKVLWVKGVDVSLGTVMLVGGGLLLGLFAFFLPAIFLLRKLGYDPSQVSSVTKWLILVVACLLGIAIVSVRSVLGKRSLSTLDESHRAAVENDLVNNQAEVLRCTASDACLVEELDDEGTGCFFDVGEGTVLFLGGQYLDDLVYGDGDGEGPRFPNEKFVLVRAPLCGHVLKLECMGRPLKAPRIVGARALAAPLPPDGAVFSGSLDTLETGLRQLQA